MTNDIHSDRPECIRAQRDELRAEVARLTLRPEQRVVTVEQLQRWRSNATAWDARAMEVVINGDET